MESVSPPLMFMDFIAASTFFTIAWFLWLLSFSRSGRIFFDLKPHNTKTAESTMASDGKLSISSSSLMALSASYFFRYSMMFAATRLSRPPFKSPIM
ncbi:MAG: hypothetical protein ACD_47C00150G0002 [uncultured bacterium]|nr:MAG: hypothetical protein ACD_47C00150G0002 [uncultured bacterium]